MLDHRRSPRERENSFEETFLTDVETLQQSPSDGGKALSPKEERLEPFVCPPPPLFTRRKYYSLFQNEGSASRHFLSDWEKKAILSRLQGQENIDEEEFQERLSHVHTRNTDPYIDAVQRRCARQMEIELHEKREALAKVEKRRNDIYFRFKNLPMLRLMDQFIAKAEIWYTIIVSHVFIRSLIHERKVMEAMERLSFLMVPMIRRYVTLLRKRRDREALVQEMLPIIPYPSPDVIRKMEGKFFVGWPNVLLELLAKYSKPFFLKTGEVLVHEGDLGRAMYMLTTGKVMVVLKNKTSKSKSRAPSNGVTIPVSSPAYVGEFALVCREPRMASIYAVTDLGGWEVSPESYEAVSRHLSPDVLNKQREATDDRRRTNLRRLFPLKVDLLRKFPFFEKFSLESLNRIIAEVEPIVLHDGDYLFEEGMMDSSVYFFQDGVAVSISEEGEETPVHSGSCIGIFECSCGVNERKKNSIISINYCDIWRMRRDLLMDVGMTEPDALLHCRKAAKYARSKEVFIGEKAPNVIRFDPYLSFCFLSSQLTRLHQLCTPVVYLNGEKMVQMGQKVTTLVIILNGCVDVTVANNGEQEVFRLSMKQYHLHSPSGRGDTASHGERGISCAIGAYEMAASLDKYVCTAVSFGLTETLEVDIHELNAVIPPELHTIMRENLRAREVVTRTYKEGDFNVIKGSKAISFASVYKAHREKELKKQRKNGVFQ